MSLITVTTSFACGGMSVARRVADELDLVLYDDRKVHEEALEMGLSPEDLKGFDRKAPGLLNRLLRRRPAEYLELMAAVVYEIARRGRGVICGNGAPYFLRDFGCALHVRIHASEPFRMQRLMEREGINSEEAKKRLEKEDGDLKGFMQYFFQMDWNDLELYDSIIKIDKTGVESATAQIVEASKTPQVKECSLTALDTMEKLSLLNRVEAAIMKSHVNPQELSFEVPEKGVVKVVGLINPMRTERGVLEIVKAVPGVKKVVMQAERHPLPGL